MFGVSFAISSGFRRAVNINLVLLDLDFILSILNAKSKVQLESLVDFDVR